MCRRSEIYTQDPPNRLPSSISTLSARRISKEFFTFRETSLRFQRPRLPARQTSKSRSEWLESSIRYHARGEWKTSSGARAGTSTPSAVPASLIHPLPLSGRTPLSHRIVWIQACIFPKLKQKPLHFSPAFFPSIDHLAVSRFGVYWPPFFLSVQSFRFQGASLHP